jgi:hypothetical protein
MNNSKFWDMDVEDAMDCHMVVGNKGLTQVCDSDTEFRPSMDDTYYSRNQIAQLPIHELSAEQLIASKKY